MKCQRQKKDGRQSCFSLVDVWLCVGYREDEEKDEFSRVECVVKESEGAYDTLMEY